MANAEYSDDRTISNNAELWRRIPPKHIVYDENRGRVRPSTAAFDDHSNGSPMSVLLGEVVVGSGRTALEALAAHQGYSLASITAGMARQCTQAVAREPLPDEPAHGVVVGSKTDKVRKKFAYGCTWIVPPPMP